MHICMYDYMYVLFCHVLYGCFVCILYIVCIYMYVFMYMCICMFVYMHVLCICIFVYVYQGFIQVILIFIWLHKKLNLHKILEHVGIEILFEIHFLLGFSYLGLFICLSDVKRPKSFRSFTPWTRTKAPLWIDCRAYSTLKPFLVFYNIWKLNLTSKNGQ